MTRNTTELIAPKCGRQAHGSECSGHRRRRERTGSWGWVKAEGARR